MINYRHFFWIHYTFHYSIHFSNSLKVFSLFHINLGTHSWFNACEIDLKGIYIYNTFLQHSNLCGISFARSQENRFDSLELINTIVELCLCCMNDETFVLWVIKKNLPEVVEAINLDWSCKKHAIFPSIQKSLE